MIRINDAFVRVRFEWKPWGGQLTLALQEAAEPGPALLGDVIRAVRGLCDELPAPNCRPPVDPDLDEWLDPTEAPSGWVLRLHGDADTVLGKIHSLLIAWEVLACYYEDGH